MKKKPKLIIFDLDGTLIDSARDLAAAVNEMRRHFGLPPLDVATITGYVGNGVRLLVSRALQGTTINVDDALRIQAPIYRAHIVDETTLYPGVAEGLRRLRDQGHILAVATNKPAEACDLILEHFGIRNLFVSVLAGGRFPVLKPEPDMILDVMATAGMPADDTWVVGDNYTDLESARRAGVRSLFVTYGYGEPGNEKPTLTCRSFGEVMDQF
jgi:phosphoglycolate phosphatase